MIKSLDHCHLGVYTCIDALLAPAQGHEVEASISGEFRHCLDEQTGIARIEAGYHNGLPPRKKDHNK